jgi:hypothetical protein
MPPDTVKVDRTTRWGNPFVVGKHGTQAECVEAFDGMMSGDLRSGRGVSLEQQRAYVSFAIENLELLRGKSLACWCREGTPCHAEVLLRLANPGTA